LNETHQVFASKARKVLEEGLDLGEAGGFMSRVGGELRDWSDSFSKVVAERGNQEFVALPGVHGPLSGQVNGGFENQDHMKGLGDLGMMPDPACRNSMEEGGDFGEKFFKD
jgi:hypothetical protein